MKKLIELIRRWLDRRTPQERAELERRRDHWSLVASHIAQNLVQSALKHRHGMSDTVYVDREKHFSDRSASFIRELIKEKIEENLQTSFDLRAITDPHAVKLGFHLTITDQEMLKKLHPARVAM